MEKSKLKILVVWLGIVVSSGMQKHGWAHNSGWERRDKEGEIPVHGARPANVTSLESVCLGFQT